MKCLIISVFILVGFGINALAHGDINQKIDLDEANEVVIVSLSNDLVIRIGKGMSGDEVAIVVQRVLACDADGSMTLGQPAMISSVKPDKISNLLTVREDNELWHIIDVDGDGSPDKRIKLNVNTNTITEQPKLTISPKTDLAPRSGQP